MHTYVELEHLFEHFVWWYCFIFFLGVLFSLDHRRCSSFSCLCAAFLGLVYIFVLLCIFRCLCRFLKTWTRQEKKTRAIGMTLTCALASHADSFHAFTWLPASLLTGKTGIFSFFTNLSSFHSQLPSSPFLPPCPTRVRQTEWFSFIFMHLLGGLDFETLPRHGRRTGRRVRQAWCLVPRHGIQCLDSICLITTWLNYCTRVGQLPAPTPYLTSSATSPSPFPPSPQPFPSSPSLLLPPHLLTPFFLYLPMPYFTFFCALPFLPYPTTHHLCPHPLHEMEDDRLHCMAWLCMHETCLFILLMPCFSTLWHAILV